MDAYLRRALLERLATDFYVLIGSAEAHRPPSMPCCWVTGLRTTGRAGEYATWMSPLCDFDCQHNHHRHEVWASQMLALVPAPRAPEPDERRETVWPVTK